MLNKDILDRLRRVYPVGCRVELLHMDDVTAPPVGTMGTVAGIDDTGSIMVDWDNGSELNCLYVIEWVRKVDQRKAAPGDWLPDAVFHCNSDKFKR